MVAVREKANLNQMLMSGDTKNIGLAFEMILNSKEDLYWIIWRAKDKLIGMQAFFTEKHAQLKELIDEYYCNFSYQNDRTIGMDISECEEMAKCYQDKLDDIVAKSNAFHLVFAEKESSPVGIK